MKELASLLTTTRVNLSTVPKAMRAVLYAATIFISFFLMLVFMTYNVSCPTAKRGFFLLTKG